MRKRKHNYSYSHPFPSCAVREIPEHSCLCCWSESEHVGTVIITFQGQWTGVKGTRLNFTDSRIIWWVFKMQVEWLSSCHLPSTSAQQNGNSFLKSFPALQIMYRQNLVHKLFQRRNTKCLMHPKCKHCINTQESYRKFAQKFKSFNIRYLDVKAKSGCCGSSINCILKILDQNELKDYCIQ